MNEYINIEGIKKVGANLSKRKDSLSNIFNYELLPLLNECASYGIDSSEYRKLYTSINDKFNVMCDLLSNVVVNNYKNIVDDINVLFNDNLKQEFDDLMRISNEE